VLEDERSLLVGVAREANSVLRCRRPDLFWPDRAVRIVAIRTPDQAFVDAMVEGHFELRLLLRVARVTKLRLRFRQQKLFGCRMVRRMTGYATDVVLGVDRVDGVHVLRAAGMAAHTASVNLFGRSGLENEDLGFVAATGHVVGAGSVATLASLARWTTFRVESGLPMRRLLPAVVNFLVTSLAGLRSHVLGNFRGSRTRRCGGGLRALIGNGLGGLARSKTADDKRQQPEHEDPGDSGTR